MRKKTALAIMLPLLAMLTLTFNIPPIQAPPDPVVIGWSHALTGPPGVPETVAVHHLYYKMIIHDYNTKYGGLNVGGAGIRPINYVELDDGYDTIPGTSLANYEYLAGLPVDLLFAPWSTAFNVALLDFFEDNQYPVVGLTVGSDTLSQLLKDGNCTYFFVTLGQPWEDAIEFNELVAYINETAPCYGADEISSAGIVYRSDEHGMEHAEAIKAGLLSIGIEVPVFESYTWYAPPTNWVPTINSFKNNNVSIAMMCGYDECSAFMLQCIAQNYNPKLFVVGPTMECPFLVFGWGFTRGQLCGVTYYNGFPATAYLTPELRAWAEKDGDHWNYTRDYSFMPYQPFPASAVFYSGLECLFDAVETPGIGLNRTLIRDALNSTIFNTLVGTFKFRVGESPVVANHGTLTQWQGGNMMDVIWPECENSTDYIIYPKYPWDYPAHVDLDKNSKINMKDISKAARAFGSYPGHPRWEEKADIDDNNKCNMKDISAIAREFGKTADFGGTIPAPCCPPCSPVACFTETATKVETGETITFNASTSYDIDGWIVSYLWDFNDTNTAMGMVVSHAYAAAGTYTVKLTVTDNNGLTDTATSKKTVVLP